MHIILEYLFKKHFLVNNFGVLDLKNYICFCFGISSTMENIMLVVPFPQFTRRETLWALTLS